jgi:uncharacterized membrane protein
MTAKSKAIWQWIVGLAFVAAGTNHFLIPDSYVSMIPAYFPAPLLLVQISGVAEILGGLGVLLAGTRLFAAWGLIALLVAVFPANVNMALHGWPAHDVSVWIFWARLPFQFLFIWWIWRIFLAKNF